MALLSFSEVTRFYGRQDVLTGVTLSINAAERVGLVGRNGAGKTTIIRLIMEKETPDSGVISRAKGLRVGYLPQEIAAERGRRLLEMVMDTAEEYRKVEAELQIVNEELAEKSASQAPEEELMELAERQGHLIHLFESLGGWEKEAEAKKILSGLGFEESDFIRDIAEFSGGWVMRAVLARLLLAGPDLLVLDEPTNHLDIDSLLWLEYYLKSSSSALLLVSHDRVFLNNVVGKIIEVRQGKAHSYIGNYDHFLLEKEQRVLTESAAFKNQQDRIKQLEKFIERNKTRASTARRAQSRVKMIEKMDKLDAPESLEEQSFNFRLPQPSRAPDIVAEFSSAAKNYGPIEVYRDLNLTLRRGDRLALIGPNGRGKSTLLKMLAGLEPISSGTGRLATGVSIGYFSQFQMDSLNHDNSILEELCSVAGDLSQGALRSVLGGFLFSGEDVFKKVAVLSGGEKARLALAKIMLQAPNLLLFDEPTNHLDIPGRQMLEDALENYGGTMVLISHDRHFINNLCTAMGIIKDGRLEIFPGTYDDYQTMWAEKIDQNQQKHPTPLELEADVEGDKKNELFSRKQNRKLEAQARRELAAKLRPYKEKIEKSEKRLAEISARKEEITHILADPSTYHDAELAKELNVEFQKMEMEAGQLESIWEEAMMALEEIDKI